MSTLSQRAAGQVTVWTDAAKKLVLKPREFVARGGEGDVYARANRGFKLAHDLANACTREHLESLSRIAHPDVLTPIGLLSRRRGRSRQRVGHEFRFISDAWSACELIPVAFSRRHALDPTVLPALVASIRERVAAVHAANCLVVDLNEMNVLVGRDLTTTFLIDTDSFQTPTRAASAILPSVADPTRAPGDYDEQTDWFSFAVLAFSLLVGIHPYRGKHPHVRGLNERMRSGISVFDPEVRLPPTCRPLAAIPPTWRAWLEAVFVDGERHAPPIAASSRTRAIRVDTGLLRRSPSPGSLRLTPVARFDAPILSVLETTARRVVVTSRRVHVDDRGLDLPQGASAHARPWTTTTGRALLADLASGPDRGDSGVLRCWDLDVSPARPLPVGVDAHALTGAGGRLFAIGRTGIVRVDAVELGAQVVVTSQIASPLLSRAARGFPGVVMQEVLGARWACLLRRDGSAEARRLAELDGIETIVDAVHSEGVLVIVTNERGRFDRWVFRFGRSTHDPDVRIERDVSPSAAAAVTVSTLERGVAISTDDHGRVEAFARVPRSTAFQRFDGTDIGDGQLVQGHERALIIRGSALLALSRPAR
jgi:hypothetical protein